MSNSGTLRSLLIDKEVEYQVIVSSIHLQLRRSRILSFLRGFPLCEKTAVNVYVVIENMQK